MQDPLREFVPSVPCSASAIRTAPVKNHLVTIQFESGWRHAVDPLDARVHLEHLIAGVTMKMMMMFLAGDFEAARRAGKIDDGDVTFFEHRFQIPVYRRDPDSPDQLSGRFQDFGGTERSPRVGHDPPKCLLLFGLSAWLGHFVPRLLLITNYH